MTTMLCPTTDRLKAFYLGQLPDEQSDELISHVGTCSTCQAELESGLDLEDSLITHLREPDADSELDREAGCNAGLLKALGALATANESHEELIETSFPKAIGEYEILKSLGHGGMGHVYLARHNKLGRMVALKILAKHRLGDHRASQRFESEMRVIGRLSHPNIVIAHDAREIDGMAVLVTEYIAGFDLGQLLQRTGPMEIADACEIVRQIAMALQYTSDQGFVHRDIKPSNIMVSNTGEVKLLDLGLARLQFGEMESAEITGTGQTMGTADYISPEQVTDSRKVDIRSDIYSLGATLYKLLSGQAPFAGQEYSSAFAKMTAHVSTTPGKLRSLRAQVPVELERLVATMLIKRPEERPQRPDAIASTLSSFSQRCDLKGMAHRAASVPLAPLTSVTQSPADTLSKPSAEPKTQSFFHRPVQLYKAIAAGFFGAAVGICLGIIITITHADGTKTTINVPDRSKIEISETGKPAKPNVEPDLKTSGLIEKPKSKPSPPLQFALLFGRATSASQPSVPSISDKELEELLDHQSANSKSLVESEHAKFLRIAEEIVGDVPVILWEYDLPLALVSTDPKYSIGWEEIQGHILEIDSTQNEGGNGETLWLKMDESLGAKMASLSTVGTGKHLAIIVDDIVVQSPKIVSVMGADIQISGHFSASQMQKMREHFLPSQRAMPSPNPNSVNGNLVQQVTKDSSKGGFSAAGEEYVFMRLKFLEVDLIKLRQDSIIQFSSEVEKAIKKTSNADIPQLMDIGATSVEELLKATTVKTISEPNLGTTNGKTAEVDIAAGKSNFRFHIRPLLKKGSATVDFDIEQIGIEPIDKTKPDIGSQSIQRSFTADVKLGRFYLLNTGFATAMETSKQLDTNLIVVVWFERLLPIPVDRADARSLSDLMSTKIPLFERIGLMKTIYESMAGERMELKKGGSLGNLLQQLSNFMPLTREDNENIANAIRAASPFKGVLSIERGGVWNDSSWLYTKTDIVYTLNISPEDLFADAVSFIRGWSADSTFPNQFLDGLANAPEGPRVKIEQDLLPRLGDTITIVASSSLIAIRLKPGMGDEVRVLLARAMELEREVLRVVGDFLLFGTKDDLDAATDRYNRQK